VVFAQQPGKSGIAVTMKGSRGTAVRMLTQGLVWVDKKNFHIRRMRMDLLARQPEIGLDEQATRVNFSEVHLPDLSTPLWLPPDVSASVCQASRRTVSVSFNRPSASPAAVTVRARMPVPL
jgi:hypothetical protein